METVIITMTWRCLILSTSHLLGVLFKWCVIRSLCYPLGVPIILCFFRFFSVMDLWSDLLTLDSSDVLLSSFLMLCFNFSSTPVFYVQHGTIIPFKVPINTVGKERKLYIFSFPNTWVVSRKIECFQSIVIRMQLQETLSKIVSSCEIR